MTKYDVKGTSFSKQIYTLTGIKLDGNLIVFILGQDFWIQSPSGTYFWLASVGLESTRGE